MSVLERIPVVGDALDDRDGTLEVQRMDGRRVDRVRFMPRPDAGRRAARDERR